MAALGVEEEARRASDALLDVYCQSGEGVEGPAGSRPDDSSPTPFAGSHPHVLLTSVFRVVKNVLWLSIFICY